MTHGANQTIDEETPDYAALAKEAGERAVARHLAAGRPVVYLKKGRLCRNFPDGHEEFISDDELREISGGLLP
jgi:hypothetical protein